MKHARLAALIMSLTTVQNHAKSDLTSLHTLAESGDAAAQLALAITLRDGEGITKNDTETVKCVHQAADQGHADAQDFVGFAYLRGAVVKRNTALAFAYFKEAADDPR